MVARIILAIIGLIAMIVGVAQIVAPDAVLNLWRPLLIGDPFAAPPRTLYIMGVVPLIIGLFLLYIGIRRLVQLSWLVILVGALSLIAGLFALISPSLFRDVVNSLIYAQPEQTKLTLNYVSGAIRIIIGLIFLIIAFRPAPERRRA
jgi:uncharacterized protein YjeT (DUF2065 family)